MTPRLKEHTRRIARDSGLNVQGVHPLPIKSGHKSSLVATCNTPNKILQVALERSPRKQTHNRVEAIPTESSGIVEDTGEISEFNC